MKHFRYAAELANALEHDRFYRSIDMARMLFWQQCVRMGINDDLMYSIRQWRSVYGQYTLETYINSFIDAVIVEDDDVEKFKTTRNMPNNEAVGVDVLRRAFREIRFPLPVAIFPGAHDNTEAFLEHVKPCDITPGPCAAELEEIRQAVDELNSSHANDPEIKPTLNIVEEQNESLKSYVESLRANGLGDRDVAKKLKNKKVTLSEIGRLLRKEGEFDSEEANRKRAQRLLAK